MAELPRIWVPTRPPEGGDRIPIMSTLMDSCMTTEVSGNLGLLPEDVRGCRVSCRQEGRLIDIIVNAGGVYPHLDDPQVAESLLAQTENRESRWFKASGFTIELATLRPDQCIGSGSHEFSKSVFRLGISGDREADQILRMLSHEASSHPD